MLAVPFILNYASLSREAKQLLSKVFVIHQHTYYPYYYSTFLDLVRFSVQRLSMVNNEQPGGSCKLDHSTVRESETQ